MRVKLDNGAKLPNRVHPTDAGLDLFALKSGWVRAKKSKTFETGVHVELPEGTTGILLPKSGLMCKSNIISFGVIDQPYRGEIMVHLFNLGDKDYWVEQGDKIGQMLIMNVRYENIEIVDKLSESDRGECGFGSSGR